LRIEYDNMIINAERPANLGKLVRYLLNKII